MQLLWCTYQIVYFQKHAFVGNYARKRMKITLILVFDSFMISHPFPITKNLPL